MHARALAYELQVYALAIITRSTGLRPEFSTTYNDDISTGILRIFYDLILP